MARFSLLSLEPFRSCSSVWRLCPSAGAPPKRVLAAFSPPQANTYSTGCPELANTARGIEVRQRELAALMAKAEVDAGGRFISAQAYGPEYAQLRGRMDQLRKTAAEKNCNLSGGVSGASGLPVEQPTSATERNLPVTDGGSLTGQ